MSIEIGYKRVNLSYTPIYACPFQKVLFRKYYLQKSLLYTYTKYPTCIISEILLICNFYIIIKNISIRILNVY